MDFILSSSRTPLLPTPRTIVSIKPTSVQWHCRLGHPSNSIVQDVLRSNNLPCLLESSDRSVCGPCQLAKSHQLPYVSSIHTSMSPLELAFTDVWGPAHTSVNGFKYYVSFVDDFSKFTWIYPLKSKAEVFNVFTRYQKYVERLLNKHIICVQSN